LRLPLRCKHSQDCVRYSMCKQVEFLSTLLSCADSACKHSSPARLHLCPWSIVDWYRVPGLIWNCEWVVSARMGIRTRFPPKNTQDRCYCSLCRAADPSTSTSCLCNVNRQISQTVGSTCSGLGFDLGTGLTGTTCSDLSSYLALKHLRDPCC
jgi:hypothetical protein